MKRALISIIITSNLLLGCAKSDAPNNINRMNANSAAVTPSETPAETAAKTVETPLPVFADASEALAEADKLFDVSNNEKAIEAYRQSVKLNPDFAEAWFKLGIAYSLFEKEQKDAGVVAEEEPTPTKRGKKDVPPKLSESGKAFESAVKAYKKILAKDPKNDEAQFNLGRAFNKLNQDTDAQKALTQAVKLKPEDVQYQIELGAILIKLAQYEEAIAPLKKAVAIDAENLQAQELLEKAQAGRKRIDFGIKPKLPPTPEPEQARPREKTKLRTTLKPKQEPTGEIKNANQ